MKVGYVGLGMMGAAMTSRLVDEGRPPLVFDLDAAAVDRAIAGGADGVGSLAELVAGVEVVSVCVPAAQHLDAVVADVAEALAGRATGGQATGPSVLLVHSTVAPETIRSAQDALAPVNIAVHDACVAGGDEAARAGDLVMLVGAMADLAPEVIELLGVYGGKVIDAGPVGAGAALKIGLNVMTYAQQVAAGVSFDLVEQAGGDTGALVDGWRHIGQLGALTERFLPMLGFRPEDLTGDFRAGIQHTVDHIMCKDLALAAELADGGRRGLAEVPELLGSILPRVYNLTDGGSNDQQ